MLCSSACFQDSFISQHAENFIHILCYFHLVNILQCIYVFSCWWIFGLFPVFCYYEQFSLNIFVYILWSTSRKASLGVELVITYVTSSFTTLYQLLFQNCWTKLYSYQQYIAFPLLYILINVWIVKLLNFFPKLLYILFVHE